MSNANGCDSGLLKMIRIPIAASFLLFLWCFVNLPSIAGRADFGCMISMYSVEDWDYDPVQKTSICMQQVKTAARQCRSDSIKITPHIYYNWTLVPNTDVAFRHLVTSFCFFYKRNYTCVAPTAALIKSFNDDLFGCMRYASELNFTKIYLIPMIDPFGSLGDINAWRNSVEFDPLVKFQKFSYNDVVTVPTVGAAKRLMAEPGNQAQVHYALSGEMNRPFVMFAKRWQQLGVEVAKQMAPYKMATIGTTFAWNKLCGNYCYLYKPGKGQTTDQGWADFRAFMATMDEVGISLYTDVWDRYNSATKTLEYTYALRALDDEMWLAANLNFTMIQAAGTKLFLNELAVGGCSNVTCPVLDGDVKELSKQAWNGVGTPYSKTNDPWAPLWTRMFRMEWYRQALIWGSTEGSAPYRWHTAFSWSQGSWDIAGIYPDSTTLDGTWYDALLMEMIMNYNKYGTVPGTSYYRLP